MIKIAPHFALARAARPAGRAPVGAARGADVDRAVGRVVEHLALNERAQEPQRVHGGAVDTPGGAQQQRECERPVTGSNCTRL